MSVWKNLELQDLHILEKHASKYDPYCHLNVVDLWSYKVTENYWFMHGDTIAYRLNDYNDDSLYTTVLGERDLKRTISMICNMSSDSKIFFKCVPKVVIDSLGNWNPISNIREDHDNHDYIFDVISIMTFSSDGMRQQSKKIRKLIRQHPELHYRLLDASNNADRNQMYRVFHTWVYQTKPAHWQKEFRALQRALHLQHANLVCLGFFDGKKMIGYTVNRPENNGYYQAYFGKSDRGYNPLSLYQEYTTACYMHEQFNSRWMNLQPDSGIDGLRKYKTSLGPSHKLLKYDLTIDCSNVLV